MFRTKNCKNSAGSTLDMDMTKTGPLVTEVSGMLGEPKNRGWEVRGACSRSKGVSSP